MLKPYPDIPQTNAPDINNDYGTIRDDAVPGDGSGSPVIAIWLNDIYGALLSTLKAAGITPNDNADNTTASQFVTALESIASYSSARTGTTRFELSNSALAGWLMMDDSTIGSASSGAAHTGVLYRALFDLIWAQTTNTNCPMFTSAGAPVARGATAADDWAANNRLSLPKQVGRTMAAVGAPTLTYNFSAQQISETFTVNPYTQVFEADLDKDMLTVTTSTPFPTGTVVRVSNSGGALPTPLLAATDYYSIQVDPITIGLCESYADAIDGVRIDLEDNGTGVQTLHLNMLQVADALAFSTGTLVQVSTTGTLPSPLTDSTDYYVVEIDGADVQLAETLADAEIGKFIEITTTGSGTHAIFTETVFEMDTGASFLTGAAITLATTGALPAPFAAATPYYPIRLDSTHFKLANSLANAFRGIAIPFSTVGSGIQTITLSAYDSYDVGASTGEQYHALTSNENGPHTHGYVKITGSQAKPFENGQQSPVSWNNSPTDSSGLGEPHNTMQPTTFYYCFIKL